VPQSLNDNLDWVAEAIGATSVCRGERIQSLWSGYGELFRVQVTGARRTSAVVKWVKPPARSRNGADDISHARKCRSYEVETTWYRELASRCDDTCRVAALLGSRALGDESVLVLEDLDAAGFSDRRRAARQPEIDLSLGWLAAFHARFLDVAPAGLWPVGTYWHLATRPDELAAIEDPALRDAAPLLDARLSGCKFKTLVHGDAKLANFCFAPQSKAIAAVDFQYVGGGCGMKDVAYLLAGDVGSEAAEQHALDSYFRALRTALSRDKRSELDVDALEREWRMLYPIACADFYRFLAGWARPHWQSDARGQRLVRAVLRSLS
jgi:Phosphotransferase enzyme family